MIMLHGTIYSHYSQIEKDISGWSNKWKTKKLFVSIFPGVLLPLLAPPTAESSFSTLTLVLVFNYILFVLLMLLFYDLPLVIQWNWGSRLNESIIEDSVNGLSANFVISIAVIVFYSVIVVGISSVVTQWTHTAVLMSLTLLFVFLIIFIAINVVITSLRLLWKVRVPSFVDELPHLIVTTKTGNVFFGQLYDPLDDKFLILRKAKLVLYSNQEVANIIENLVSHTVLLRKQENYLSIPWDEIETLQIVEDGLYRAPQNAQ